MQYLGNVSIRAKSGQVYSVQVRDDGCIVLPDGREKKVSEQQYAAIMAQLEKKQLAMSQSEPLTAPIPPSPPTPPANQTPSVTPPSVPVQQVPSELAAANSPLNSGHSAQTTQVQNLYQTYTQQPQPAPAAQPANPYQTANPQTQQMAYHQLFDPNQTQPQAYAPPASGYDYPSTNYNQQPTPRNGYQPRRTPVTAAHHDQDYGTEQERESRKGKKTYKKAEPEKEKNGGGKAFGFAIFFFLLFAIETAAFGIGYGLGYVGINIPASSVSSSSMQENTPEEIPVEENAEG